MILACLVLYDADTAFPGLSAVPVVLGTVLLIWSGAEGGTVTARLFSSAPLVRIGKLSYSLYLWHWPPLVVARNIGGGEISLAGATISIGFAFLAAWLSLHLVEAPFRGARGEALLSKARIFRLSAISLVALAIIGTTLLFRSGFPGRIPAEVAEIYATATAIHPLEKACRTNAPGKPDPDCRIGDLGAPAATIAIWGDSHAGALLAGIDPWLIEQGRKAEAFIRYGCPPSLGLMRKTYAKAAACEDSRHDILQYLTDHADLQVVILAARWPYAFHDTRFGEEAGGNFGGYSVDGSTEGPAILSQGLKRVVQELRSGGLEVILIGGIPEIGRDVAQHRVNRAFYGGDEEITLPGHIVAARQSGSEAMLQEAARTAGVYFFPMLPAFCTPDCRTEEGGRLLYRDDDHLSILAAKTVALDVLREIPLEDIISRERR